MKDYTESELKVLSKVEFDDVCVQVHARYSELSRKIDAIDKRTEFVLRDPKINRSKIQKIKNDRSRLAKEIAQLKPTHDAVLYEAIRRGTRWTKWWKRRRKIAGWPITSIGQT